MSYRKILIINIFGIGDVLFSTPLIANLKAAVPEASIGYVANTRTAPIVQSHPDVDRVFIYERDDFHAAWQSSKIAFVRKARALLEDIRREQYDCVIDLSLNASISFLTWYVGIPKRIGYNYKNRGVFLTDKIALNGYEGRHVVEYYLDLLKPMSVPVPKQRMQIPVSPDAEEWAESFLNQHALVGRQRVALIPGGGASWGKDAVYKRWPAEKYAQLADKIIANFGFEVILMGDQNEKELCRSIARAMRQKSIDLSGQTNLQQMSALLKRCSLAVVNDGGPLHIAVASGLRTLSVFGPVDERVYGPFPRENHEVVISDIPCRPCYRQFRRAGCEHISCLTNIEPDHVYNIFEKMINQKN